MMVSSMSEEMRYSAVGKQYIPCDTYEQFLESDFGKFIEGFLYTVDKEGILTIAGSNGKVQVRPYQYLYVYDEDAVYVKDAGEIQ